MRMSKNTKMLATIAATDPLAWDRSAPTAAWIAFRKVLPWQQEVDSRPDVPYGAVAYNFLKQTPASTFYSGGPLMPATDGQLMVTHSKGKE
jgi:hypothetical protein